jgi:hypothetical protein
MHTDKKIFFALRAGLSVQQRVEVNVYDEPKRNPEILNTRTDHRSSFF